MPTEDTTRFWYCQYSSVYLLLHAPGTSSSSFPFSYNLSASFLLAQVDKCILEINLIIPGFWTFLCGFDWLWGIHLLTALFVFNNAFVWYRLICSSTYYHVFVCSCIDCYVWTNLLAQVFLRLHIHNIMMMNFDPFYVFCPRKKALHSIGLDNIMVWPLRIVVVFSLFKFRFHNFQLRSLFLLLVASWL